MLYKAVILCVALFSLKTFAVEKQESDKSAAADNLSKKQLEIIIQSIKADSSVKSEKRKS